MASYSATKYYTSAYTGQLFVGQSSAPKTGVLIPIADSVSPTFGLWNPLGSNKNAVLVRFAASFVSTTGAPGGILYNNLAGAGSTIATAAPISAFNAVAATNCLLGGGLGSVMKFTGAGTNTLTTAGTTFATMGVSQLTTTGTGTGTPMYTAVDDIDGRIIVAPGNFFYITGSAALLSLFDMSMFWEENPV